MTNEEAIMILKAMIDEMILVFDRDRKKALNMAIEALKEQPEHSQNTSSKQPDLETLGVKTEETCEDVISRRDAIDAILADKIDAISLKVMTALGDGRLALTLNVACDRHIRDIEKLPSAVPEVIHCKDCKYMRRDVIFDQCWCNCSSRVSPIDDDEYCSRADRRKE